MSYNISVTNHPTIIIQDGTKDTSTSLTLVGKNFPNYGQYIAQNLVSMTQSWAGVSQPTSALTGQLWYDTSNNALKVYTGSTFKSISSVTTGNSTPLGAVAGDLWYNTSTNQLSIYTGTAWLLIGPSYTSAQQKTAAIAENITDTLSNSHVVLMFYVAGTLVGIVSKDPEFTPLSGITGFPTIKPGYNVNLAIYTASGILVTGTITQNAQPYITSLGTLSGLTVSSRINGSIFGYAETVKNAAQPNITSVGAGLTVYGTIQGPAVNAGTIGNAGAVIQGASISTNTANVATLSATTALTAPIIGTPSSVIYGTVANPNVIAGSQTGITAVGTLTGLTVSNKILPSANASIDIGATTTQWFRNIYATTFYGVSSRASYADLAENYVNDGSPGPNDIVVLGGSAEVTRSTKSHDPKVVGVMSPNPAYLMNSAIDGVGTPVALTGRVYVNVKGPIERGDCVVSSDIPGVGEKLDSKKYVPGCIVGKSMSDISSNDIELIEVIIGIR